MNTSFSFRTMAIGLLLVALIVAGRLAGYYHDNYKQALGKNAEQEKVLTQHREMFAIFQKHEASNRALMAKQQREEELLRQQNAIYQRKYQDAIKNDECAHRTAPGAVLSLLRGTDTAGVASAVSP